MIALLCPTKGRPEQYGRMCKSAWQTSNNENVRLVWQAISQEDNAKYGQIEAPYGKLYLPDGMPTSHKWNLLADFAMQDPNNKFFMLAADDMVFATPLWDKALLDHYNSLENKIHVYALRDSRDPEGTPHPIVTREWIEAMGYAFPPIFLHWFLDTWTVDIAKANNCFTHMKDYLLVHEKPSDIGKPDLTHTGIRSMGWHERDQYVAKTCAHFLESEKARLAWHFNKSAGGSYR